ncbi:MAG: glutamate--tRNA ligase [Gammaproteobacteria bacterium]|nr:glutamate--tRNA ligase [Gammaproteobacteria bacterium]
MTVRTRFAPSPTGHLHIGGVRTALYSWLYARRYGGQFVLRIEDTDRERSTGEYEKSILEGIAWLGLDYDEGPFYQSQRLPRYREVIGELLQQDKAYHCYCSKEDLDAMREQQRARGQKPRYDGCCRDNPAAKRPDISPVVRFKNPLAGDLVIDDKIRGRVIFSNEELDDLIIARADGAPTYNFTVVVDDVDMSISHVIRGDDHLNNTPRQVNIFEALGVVPPIYAHVPMILGADGQKLSKRHGALSVLEYREQGYLPQALLNYLVRLGWSHGDQEIFSIEEMQRLFDIADVNKAASAFNTEKLLWLNQHYIKASDTAFLVDQLRHFLTVRAIDISNGPDLSAVVEVQRERAKTLVEMAQKSEVFYRDFENYDEKAATKNLKPEICGGLRELRERFAAIDNWDAELIHEAIEDIAAQQGLKFGKLAQPLRVAVTGSTASPPIDTTLVLLGRRRTVERLDRAIRFIDRDST